MKLKWKFYFNILLILIFTLFYCEYLIYYVVIKQCSWPEYELDSEKFMIKSMFLADTHLLGPFRGHWLDKLRREWQMYRSFQTAISIFKPDAVFVLGDLFDEGKWCNRDQINEYISRFSALFQVPEGVHLFAVPGNHDVGFHYALRPFLLNKFSDSYNISDVKLINLKGNYFVLINSMAMEGDGCYLCSSAEEKLKKIAADLKCIKNGKCAKLNENYSRPIVLQHFPMYRKSDSHCNEIDSAPVSIRNVLFKEKWDCLSEKASKMIFDELNPRAIFTGHVHHGCHTIHKGDIHEYTISSFSWRNKENPNFILAKITPHNHLIEKCHLPRENTVIAIYSLVLLSLFLWIIYRKTYFYIFKHIKKSIIWSEK